MAEVYVDPPLLEAFGFNGGLGDSKMCPTYAKTQNTRARAHTPHAHARTHTHTHTHTHTALLAHHNSVLLA